MNKLKSWLMGWFDKYYVEKYKLDKALKDIKDLKSNNLKLEELKVRLAYIGVEMQKSYDVIAGRLNVAEAKYEALKTPIKFIEKPTKYKMKPNFYDYLHKGLNKLSKDTEYLSKYTAFIQEIGVTNKSNADSQVYFTVLRVYDWLDSQFDDYDTDEESFGTKEYWLNPQEAYDYYVLDKDAGDCEDFAHLLWGCIIASLKLAGFDDDVSRLYQWDVKRPIGHALLIWLNKEGLYKRIESTYNRQDFKTKWKDKSDVFRSVFAITWHIFNEETEYKLK